MARTVVGDEPLDFAKTIKFSESMMEALRAKSKESGASIAEELRRAMMRGLNENGAQKVEIAPPSSLDMSVPIIGSAICGPFAEAVTSSSDVHLLSEQTAEELEAREGDVFVRAYQESMEGAGILDNALVLMRPSSKEPRRGEIWLLQIFTEEGDCKSTIKRYDGKDSTGQMRLLDGSDNEYSIPDEAQKIMPVAIVRGVIAALR